MIDLNAIFSQENISEIISSLKERTTESVDWETLAKHYDPSLHEILTDTSGRKDKTHSDGTTDKAARISIGLDELLCKRMAEFTFAIPVKRVYNDTDTDERKAIAKALEKIYIHAHINSENKKRALAYYASCEILTIWYTKKEKHNFYGFPCNFKLKCKTFSPMDNVTLWPLIDERGEMYAMSYEYEKKVKDVLVSFFETFTADKHYCWQKGEEGEWEAVTDGEEITINKIPAIYLYRPKPVFAGLQDLRKDIEYTLSRNSDVLAYNCAPILKVAGSIVGEEAKGETRRIYRVSEGGDVSYVSWSQSIAALQYHIQTLLWLFWTQAQMPDISFDNMRSLGNIGYDARKTLFADAHLKIGDESGAWLEFLEREGNVIKAFLKKLNVGFSEEDIDAVSIEHIITPYIQEDESLTITTWMKANGGKPLISHKESIKRANLTNDPEQSYSEILAEGVTEGALQNGSLDMEIKNDSGGEEQNAQEPNTENENEEENRQVTNEVGIEA